MNDKILIIAHHFPPCAEVSGALRTLSVARYISAYGLQPIVLTANQLAYPDCDTSTYEMIPEDCRVERAFALDARRHLGIRGHYPAVLALPDRWATWWFDGVRKGARLIAREKPSVIWSTYPIATAHMIASTLHRISGVPWIADFRDPVIGPQVSVIGSSLRTRALIEAMAVRQADACVFVTQGARELYAKRYAETPHGEFAVIPNGFDEDAFAGLSVPAAKRPGAPLVIVHSGVLYPEGRNPEAFFTALAHLMDSGRIARGQLKVVLRASGNEDAYRARVRDLGLGPIVRLAPPVSRKEALQEQLSADALLLFQGSAFNPQIPAKVYEYLKAQKPILALTDAGGETARFIAQTGVGKVVPLDDSEAIERCLPEFLSDVVSGRLSGLAEEQLRGYSRRGGVVQLYHLIQRVVTRNPEGLK